MTSYTIEVKQCPKCNCVFSANQLNSCNTINAIYYSDGAIYGPMYSENNLLITCPNCHGHFWREDVPTSKSISESDFIRDNELQLLPTQNLLGMKNFISLLHEEFWETKAQEKYIRIRAWWSYNDIYRGKAYNEFFQIPNIDFMSGMQRKDMTEDDFKLSFEGKDNLLKLLPLLDTSNLKEIITKSEVFRELGQFDECIKLLDQPFNDRFLPIVNTIKNLAIGKKQMVGQILEKTSNETHLFI